MIVKKAPQGMFNCRRSGCTNAAVFATRCQSQVPGCFVSQEGLQCDAHLREHLKDFHLPTGRSMDELEPELSQGLSEVLSGRVPDFTFG